MFCVILLPWAISGLLNGSPRQLFCSPCNVSDGFTPTLRGGAVMWFSAPLSSRAPCTGLPLTEDHEKWIPTLDSAHPHFWKSYFLYAFFFCVWWCKPCAPSCFLWFGHKLSIVSGHKGAHRTASGPSKIFKGMNIQTTKTQIIFLESFYWQAWYCGAKLENFESYPILSSTNLQFMITKLNWCYNILSLRMVVLTWGTE